MPPHNMDWTYLDGAKNILERKDTGEMRQQKRFSATDYIVKGFSRQQKKSWVFQAKKTLI